MAVDPRLSDLIQADIDSEIAADDKAELDAFLAQSNEGRALYEEFASLAKSLDEMEDVEVPAHLKHVIMNMAPTKAGAVADAQPAPGLLSRIFAGPVLGYVGVFAAGVILSLAFVESRQISTGAFDDITGLVGTIADVEKIGPVRVTVPIDENEVAGTVSLRTAGSLMILDFDLSANDVIEIEASYSDRTIWFNGFAQLESSGTSVAATAGSVRLAMDGKRRYAVFLNNPGRRPATITMQFMARGQVIHEANIDYTQ